VSAPRTPLLPFPDPAAPPPYRVVRSRRRSIAVTVHEDGEVEVRAPRWVSERRIRQTVEEHREWIARTRAKHVEQHVRVRARRFDDGDRVPYRGRELVLAVRAVAAPRGEAARAPGDRLAVEVPEASDRRGRREAARAAVGRWLLEEARRIFHERHVAAARRVGRAAASLTIKHMTSRWGSCGREARMSLDWRLVMAPPEVLDYVLVHELVHIEVHDHSRRFWARVAEACPGHRSARRWLAEHGGSLVL